MTRVFKQRLTKMRYVTTWDVPSILNYMKQHPRCEGLKSKQTAERLAFLLALTAVQRSLATLKIDNLEKFNTGTKIKIETLPSIYFTIY